MIRITPNQRRNLKLVIFSLIFDYWPKKDRNIQAVSELLLVTRSEILWAHFSIDKNLSFNLSDYASDSKIAKSLVKNRKKTKKLIEEVLLGAITIKRRKYMKNLCSLAFDYSRDIANSNEFIIETMQTRQC